MEGAALPAGAEGLGAGALEGTTEGSGTGVTDGSTAVGAEAEGAAYEVPGAL